MRRAAAVPVGDGAEDRLDRSDEKSAKVVAARWRSDKRVSASQTKPHSGTRGWKMDVLFDVNSLGTAIGAAGALGTACFGIVEGLKWTRLGEMGFGRLQRILGDPLKSTLVVAYGEQYEQ